MFMVRCVAEDGKSVLINPKDIRWVKENEDSARIEFMSGEQVVVKFDDRCEDFDDLEQKILDASLPEIDLKSFDGIKVYVVKGEE